MSAASRSRRTTPTRSMSRATRYKLADYKPYLFRSTRWRQELEVDRRRPARRTRSRASCAPIRCARACCIVGTETGVFFSLDDGAHWTRMDGGLPWCRSTTSSSRTPTWWRQRMAARSGSSTTSRRCAALADGGSGDAAVRAAHGDPHQAALERRRQRAHRHRLRAGLRHRRQHASWSTSPTARGCASISMSARTRRTARSSTTGWPRTPRSRSRSPSATRRAARSRPSRSDDKDAAAAPQARHQGAG